MARQADPSIEITPSDEATLDAVLTDSYATLADSLQQDDRRRRRRRLLAAIAGIGGIAMCVLIAAIMAGWLTLVGVPGEAMASEAGVASKQLAQQGWQLWQQQKFDQAITKFEQAVDADSENANAWNGLGWARFNSGDSIQAVGAFEKCVDLEPKHPAAQNGLGQVYLSWRVYDTAEKHLKKAAPSAPAAWYGLGRLYLLTGEYDQSKRWIRKALSQNPGDAGLKELMEAAKAKELSPELRAKIEGPGKPTEEDLVASSKQDGMTVGQAWKLVFSGNPGKAVPAFRAILKEAPENFGAMNGLGFALLNSGEHEEAKGCFEKCLEQQPKAGGPMNGLARCLYAEDDLQGAIKVWEEMQASSPGVNAATIGLATTYFELGQFEKSAAYYEMLVESDPNNRQYAEGLKAAQEQAEEEKSE